MAVRFVIGRAGVGKTRRCLSRIVEILGEGAFGNLVYWVLPRQATFGAERELTCNAGLAGFFRARVLSFDRLVHELVGECGGGAVPEVTRQGRLLVLSYLLRREAGRLRFFGKSAGRAGLAARVDAAIEEFERGGLEPADVMALAGEVGDGDSQVERNPGLGEKLWDLGVIYGAYCEYLGQERLDPRRRMRETLGCMEKSKKLAGAWVFVDGFGEFDEFQRRILAGLAKRAAGMEIALLMDPDSAMVRAGGGALPMAGEMSLFHSTEMTYRRLNLLFRSEGVGVEGPVLLREQRRFVSADLAGIERGAFEGGALVKLGGEGVKLVEASDRRGEVDAAAREVRRLVAGGHRLRDIAVVVRRLGDYDELIRSSFGEHGIRYFLDQRRTVGHHAVPVLIRAAVLIALEGWPMEQVMTLARSGLAGVTLEEVDELENYVLKHRIGGMGWEAGEAWAFGGDGEGARRVDGVRRKIAGAMEGYLKGVRAGVMTLRRHVTLVFELLERLGVRGILGGWIDEARGAGELDLAVEHERVWGQMVGLLDQIVELIGEDALSLDGFREVLEVALESFDLGLTPPMVDEVLVGQIDRTRMGAVRSVLVLGLNEGVFPGDCRGDGELFADSERKEIRRRNVEVRPDAQRRLLDESLLGYLAMTRGSESLWLSCSCRDSGGRGLEKSAFWRRVVEMLPAGHLVERIPADARGRGDLVGTPRELLTGVMHWAREVAGGGKGAGIWGGVYSWLAGNVGGEGEVERLRRKVWGALGYENRAVLARGTILDLFAEPLEVTAAEVESFAKCPFQHFVRYGLGLEEVEGGEVTGLDLSRLYHSALEKMVGEMIRKRVEWGKISEGQIEEMVKACVREVAPLIRRQIMLSDGRSRHLVRQVERTLGEVAAAQRAIIERGLVRVTKAPVKYGKGETAGAMEILTRGGKVVRLEGQMDRADVFMEEKAFAVMDYRLGEERVDLNESFHGLSVKLLVSMMALAEASAKNGKALKMAAGFYLNLVRGIEAVEHPGEAMGLEDPNFHLRSKPRGIVNKSFAGLFDRTEGPAKSKLLSRNDVIEEEGVEYFLNQVREKIGEIGDRMMKGEIKAFPYRLGTESACGKCGFAAICRFETGVNEYHSLRKFSKDSLLGREEP